VTGKDSLVRGISNAIGTRAGETEATSEGTRVGRSGRRDDGGATEEIKVSGTWVKETVSELRRSIL